MNETECPICCDTYTASKRHKVECPKCQHMCCRECVKTYTTGQASNPHCMKCENEFEREFVYTHLGRTFMNTTYKQIKKELLFEIEKSRFPDTMPRAVAWHEAQEMKKERDLMMKERKRLRDILREQDTTINEMNDRIWQIETGNVTVTKERSKFLQPCVVEDCNGYLSTAWKCELCKNHVCPKCHVVLGTTKDADHVCEPAVVETISLIKKETKPCPKCHAPIFKISGCDQMWCTQCEVAFSWKTGHIQRGHIHNPHYYEAQRRTGMIVRNPGDVVCGGIMGYPGVQHLFRQISFPMYSSATIFQQTIDKKILYYVYRIALRGVAHSQHILNQLRASIRHLESTEHLRVAFLTKQVDETAFKRSLFQNSEKMIKQRKMCDIFELFMNVATENVNEVFNIIRNHHLEVDKMFTDIVVCLDRLDKIIEYSEEEFMKIAKEYKQATYVFNYDLLELNYGKPTKPQLSGDTRWEGWRRYIELRLER